MYIFFEKPNPRNFVFIDNFGVLNFWDIFLCSYHSNFLLNRKKISAYNDCKTVCSYCTLQLEIKKYVTIIGCTKSELNV